MSILIKGMEMPTRCYTCPCADLEFYDCNLMPGTRIEQHKRLDACPLVTVPPHGRLIDADALVNKHFGKEFLTRVMTADEDDLGTALVNVPLVINNAPTIIPADPEAEQSGNPRELEDKP